MRGQTCNFDNSDSLLQTGRLLLGMLSLVLLVSSGLAAGLDRPRLVVVLYPDANDGRPGNVLTDKGIRSIFSAETNEQVEVYNEFLDVARFRDTAYVDDLTELLKRKYTGRNVDLVIAGMAPALDFALDHRDSIFPGIPLVYCTVDQREVGARKLPPDVIGVPITFDAAATLDMALRFHPKTKHVYVVVGNSAFDARWEAEVRRVFSTYGDRVAFEYLVGLPLPDLLARVSELPEDSIIYYLHVFRDNTGTSYVPAEVLEQIAGKARAPIYGHVDTYVGRGAVGGRVMSFEREGQNAARLGLRIMKGDRPDAIAVPAVSPNTDMFDWRQLQRFGIRQQDLPAGSIVLFKELGFWDEYKWHVAGVIALFLIQAGLIMSLLVQRTKRRRAEERFRHAVEAAPSGMMIVERDGTIVLANPQIERMSGYRCDELVGQSTDLLVAQHSRPHYHAYREQFFLSPETRPTEAGPELFGQRKDGSEFPVEIGLGPFQTSRGLFVLESVTDITDRRLADLALQQSQQQLRQLSGELLHAQEQERRRIAREIHDDFNQSLALLCVELEMLGKDMPGLGQRAAELSTRAKQLASALHRLSHELHPLKLEQLGLLAAVQALCQEMTANHALQIEFQCREPLEALPKDTALCLYRIVQEALSNVVRHSGASLAHVELAKTDGKMSLRIKDNGHGFDFDTAIGQGLGLISMRERLLLVGGEYRVQSSPARGTQIEAWVPVVDSAESNGRPKHAAHEAPQHASSDRMLQEI